jgi:RNA polymerase sigma factor (sigma-70 family)
MVEMTADRSLAERLAIDAVQEHGPVLLATARLLTLDEAAAQDLVQATLEIALRRLDTLRDPNALRTWLLRIETREALRLSRRLRRFVRFDSERHDRPDPGADPASCIEDADLRTALAALPARSRAAVVLHHMAGLQVRETATALGVSENTVKTQLKAGLARLREALDHD